MTNTCVWFAASAPAAKKPVISLTEDALKHLVKLRQVLYGMRHLNRPRCGSCTPRVWCCPMLALFEMGVRLCTGKRQRSPPASHWREIWGLQVRESNFSHFVSSRQSHTLFCVMKPCIALRTLGGNASVLPSYSPAVRLCLGCFAHIASHTTTNHPQFASLSGQFFQLILSVNRSIDSISSGFANCAAA